MLQAPKNTLIAEDKYSQAKYINNIKENIYKNLYFFKFKNKVILSTFPIIRQFVVSTVLSSKINE